MKSFQSIGVAGLGLLGGSIALAAKRKGLAENICGYTRTPETLKKAKNLGVIDFSFQDFSDLVMNSDFVILAAPISVNVELAKSIAKIKPMLLFTDVGSTKDLIVQTVEKSFMQGHRFCGSHPMAGSEKRGIENSNPHLFEGKTVVITPANNSESSVIETIEEFWRNTGASVTRMQSRQHDEICAYTSHFPHLVAFLLVDILSERINSPSVKTCIGAGFRDTTRIAASDEEIWTEIFVSNRENILQAISKFRKDLDNVTELLQKQDFDALKSWIEKIKKIRNEL